MSALGGELLALSDGSAETLRRYRESDGAALSPG